jgi:23S rRNA pseudouridine2605 synthase
MRRCGRGFTWWLISVPERLNKYLASTGLASRRAAEVYIREGRVTVNGAVGELGTRVEAGDDVRLDGDPVTPEATIVVLLNKPAGMITSVGDPQGRPTVVDVVKSDVRLFPVGRLDRATTGALVLTNDGALAHHLMHPRHGVEKTYLADLEGAPSDEALDRLRAGVELEDGITSPAAVRRLSPTRVEITIHEGRNRQVRRMCAAVGYSVRTLHRSRYGPLTVDGLARGAWRAVEAEELAELRDA